ncbi:DUF6382 domain-containing protein [Paenibacillus chitinolyticus]|uniref:DUF6382 domain-containing protein n=1 Tax=Paenibacillus chitinolyticus TaxID=79263 RepID=UPI0035D58EFF
MEIFGLQASVRLSQGRWLEVGLEEGLNIEHLAPLQLKMLEENPIPRVLSLKVEEIDSHVRLLYNLASRRSLAAILKERSPDPAGCLQLLHEAAACVRDSGNFMLNEAQFVVDKNYIYIERGWADVSLLCLPIKEIPAASASVMWSALVRDLGSRLQAEERGSLERLAKYCERESFSVREFKRQIYLEISENRISIEEDIGKLGMESDPIVQASNIPNSEMQGSAEFSERSGYAVSVLKKPGQDIHETDPLHFKRESNDIGDGLLRRESAHVPQGGTGSPHRIVGESRSDPKPHAAPRPPQPPQAAPAGAAASAGPLRGSRGKILALVGAFPIIAMIWNAYFSAPEPPLLYISSGATLLVLDAAYVLLAIGLPGRRNSQSKEAAPSGSSSYPPAAEQEPVSLERYYAGLGERTTLLAPPLSAVNNADETVFLGGASAPPPAKFRHPVLEVMREGRKETILLDADSFIIGRGEGDSDYIENVLGISRIHAQFLRTPEGYAVKDLGSRNGTFLNDGMLVPYHMVALKDGDVVRIIHTEFSFRFG